MKKMIDKLVLHIPFLDSFCVKYYDKSKDRELFHVPIKTLPITLVANECHVASDGSIIVDRLSTKFESLPSSFSSMAIKVYNDGLNSDAFVAIKCSPSKLIQGHNVFGINCFKKSARNMLSLLATSNPALFSMLDIKHTQISEFDLTYSSFIPNPSSKRLFLDYIGNISQGQTKNRGSNYATTRYFGAKNTRLKSLKIYSKFEEVEQDLSKLHHENDQKRFEILSDILNTDFCKNAVRFEASIKKRYLQRRGIPTNLFDFLHYTDQNVDFNQEIWADAFADIFKALDGQELKMMNDEAVYQKIFSVHSGISQSGSVTTQKVNRVFAFYSSLKTLGFYHLKQITSYPTFMRNIHELELCGFSRAYLQNLNADHGAVIIPILRFIEIDFSKQHPTNYIEAPDLQFAS